MAKTARTPAAAWPPLAASACGAFLLEDDRGNVGLSDGAAVTVGAADGVAVVGLDVVGAADGLGARGAASAVASGRRRGPPSGCRAWRSAPASGAASATAWGASEGRGLGAGVGLALGAGDGAGFVGFALGAG